MLPEQAEMFALLMQNGVFDTVSGSVILHFNNNGQLAKIDRNQILFILHK